MTVKLYQQPDGNSSSQNSNPLFSKSTFCATPFCSTPFCSTPFCSTPFCPTHNGSVDSIVRQVLDDSREELNALNINIESDLESFAATVDHSIIQSAARSLLKNAATSLPDGGEISVTLIDGQYQWELEVADGTGIHSFEQLIVRNQRLENTQSENTQSENALSEKPELPTIIPFPITEQLRMAHRLAMAHGGHVQTWDCPQGGTANVLVIPRKNAGNKASTTDNEVA